MMPTRWTAALLVAATACGEPLPEDDSLAEASAALCTTISLRRWRTTVQIEPNSPFGSPPDVAISDNGTGMAVWRDQENGATQIKASRYWRSPSQIFPAWENPVVIATIASNDTSPLVADTRPRVVLDPAGDATVIYVELTTGGARVLASRYLAAWNVWGGPVELATSATVRPVNVDLAVDAAGNVIAVWEQWGSLVVGDIYAARFTPVNGWDAAAALDLSAASAQSPKIAAAPDGRMTAVWTQAGTGTVARRFVGGAWGASALVVETGGNNPEVAMNASGDAAFLSSVFPMTGEQTVFGRRLRANQASVGAPRIFFAERSAQDGPMQPTVAYDDADNMLAAWTQLDGTERNVYGRRFRGTRLDAAQLHDTRTEEPRANAVVRGDRAGLGFTAWLQADGAGQRGGVFVRKSEYRAATAQCPESFTWSPPVSVQGAVDGVVIQHALAVGGGGALLVWQQENAVSGFGMYAVDYR